MSVSITWSYITGGPGITDIVDHGNVQNGNSSSVKEIHMRHNGNNVITNTKLFIRQYSGTYTGSFTAAADLAEILAWGDGATEASFGGFMINFKSSLGTAYTSGWPTYDHPTTTDNLGYTFRTEFGDNESNAILLPIGTGVTTAGEIDPGSSPNVRFGVKCKVPSSESVTGIRQWENVAVYTYTS